jgi:hypothetical protein
MGATQRSGKGHEDHFQPPSLNGRYRLGEGTFVRASGNDEVCADSGRSAVFENQEKRTPKNFSQRLDCSLPVYGPIRLE